MKKYLIIIIIIILNFIHVFSQDSYDDLIVDRIYNILIEEYDKYDDKTFEEQLVLKFSRKTFFESVLIWKNNYKNLNKIQIDLHPRIEHMAKIAEENSDEATGKRFRELLKELTFLSYRNLQLYYSSVKDYLAKHNLSYIDINKDMIDISVAMPVFYHEKLAMYDNEEAVKVEIRNIMREGKLKQKMGFYVFAFDFLNKIRKKVIKRDIERMTEIVNASKKSNK